MSTMYVKGWGTVHMWDKPTVSANRFQPRRRINIESKVDDEEESEDVFNGRYTGAANISEILTQ